MSARWGWQIGPALLASWTDACSVLTGEEFQRAYGVNPQIGILPDDPTQTEMAAGPHCDISRGSVTLFTKATPSAALDGMPKTAKADKRVPVQRGTSCRLRRAADRGPHHGRPRGGVGRRDAAEAREPGEAGAVSTQVVGCRGAYRVAQRRLA